jgi:hypothetical protein
MAQAVEPDQGELGHLLHGGVGRPYPAAGVDELMEIVEAAGQ